MRLTKNGWTLQNPGHRKFSISNRAKVREILDTSTRVRAFAWYNTGIISLKNIKAKTVKDSQKIRLQNYFEWVHQEATGPLTANLASAMPPKSEATNNRVIDDQ
jgi:hypothetical protein